MPTVQPIIVTTDVARLQRFYTALLGAEESSRVPEDGPVFYVGLRLGDSEIGLVTEEEMAPGGRIVLSIDVPDVDALLPQVEELGGEVLGPANDMPWGQRVAHVRDPDGNAVNLTQQI